MKKIHLSLLIVLNIAQVFNPSAKVVKNWSATNNDHLLNQTSKAVLAISQKYKDNSSLINYQNISTDLRNSQALVTFLNNFKPYWNFSHVDLTSTYIRYVGNNWEWGNPSEKFSNYVRDEVKKILFYVFFLSVISDILRYYGDNRWIHNRFNAVNQNLQVVENIQKNINLLNTVNTIIKNTRIKKDGDFLTEINRWEPKSLTQIVLDRQYHKSKLLDSFYKINYDHLSNDNVFTRWSNTNDNNSLLFKMYQARGLKIWVSHQIKSYDSFKFDVNKSPTNFTISFENQFTFKDSWPVKNYYLHHPGNFDFKFW